MGGAPPPNVWTYRLCLYMGINGHTFYSSLYSQDLLLSYNILHRLQLFSKALDLKALNTVSIYLSPIPECAHNDTYRFPGLAKQFRSEATAPLRVIHPILEHASSVSTKSAAANEKQRLRISRTSNDRIFPTPYRRIEN